jgi:nucleoside-diphosphate-sugar epimerase
MRLLLTGMQSFTGRHLVDVAKLAGYEVFALEANLLDEKRVLEEVAQISPSHVIHLAGISHVTAGDPQGYYKVNLLGSLTLLDALAKVSIAPQKLILASSANVYGNNNHSPISEGEAPSPISHYAMSKLAMEYMSRPFLEKFPIVITRPFNYTGVGHASNFVIPKIVEHFKRRSTSIDLGNLDVFREYNDVRDISKIYLALLAHGRTGQTYNLASGRVVSLRQIIELLEKLTSHSMSVEINQKYVRANEIVTLSGSSNLLEKTIGKIAWRPLEETLQWMLDESPQSSQSVNITRALNSLGSNEQP